MSKLFLRLPDGTAWPNPVGVISEASRRARYGEPTKEDLTRLAEVAEAYWHLAVHPAGSESVIKQLRLLRRAVKAELEGPGHG